MFVLTPPIPPAKKYEILQSDVERPSGRHFTTLIPSAPGATSRSHKRCQVCYAQKKSTEKGSSLKASHICADCPLSPGFHPDKYLRIYHTELNF